MTVKPENLPEHQVHLTSLADVVDLATRARAAGVPPEVACKLPTFVLAKQLGRDHGLALNTEVRLRKALRLVLDDDSAPTPPVARRSGILDGALAARDADPSAMTPSRGRRRRNVGTKPIPGLFNAPTAPARPRAIAA